MPEALNQEVSQFNPESKIPAMQAENKQSFASQEDKAQSYSGGAETLTKELGSITKLSEKTSENALDASEDVGSEYSEAELNAMSVEGKRAFLAELQSIAKDTESVRKLEKTRNKQEKNSAKLDQEINAINEQITQKLAEFNTKKDAIEEKAVNQSTEAVDQCDSANVEIKAKSRANLKEITGQLGANQEVAQYEDNIRELKDVIGKWSTMTMTPEIQGEIDSKKSSLRSNVDVSGLTEQIKLEQGSKESQINESRNKMVGELSRIETSTAAELNELKSQSMADLIALQESLKTAGENRTELTAAMIESEEKIDSANRLKESINLIKDQLKEIKFSNAEKIMDDVEERAVNSASLGNLELSQENVVAKIEDVQAEIVGFAKETKKLVEQAIDSINTQKAEELEAINAEKMRIMEAEDLAHQEYKDALYAPMLEALNSLQTEHAVDGEQAAGILSAAYESGLAANKAMKKVEKAKEALTKLKGKVDKRFAKLHSRVREASLEAKGEVQSRGDVLDSKLETARNMTVDSLNGDFDINEPKVKAFFKKTFSRIFKKK